MVQKCDKGSTGTVMIFFVRLFIPAANTIIVVLSAVTALMISLLSLSNAAPGLTNTVVAI